MKQFVLTCLIVSVLFGHRADAKCVVNHYYMQQNRAEMLIVDSSYKSALKVYDSIFRYKRNAIDLYNASICALYLKDNRRALTYLRMYFKTGAKRFYADSVLRHHLGNLPDYIFDSLHLYSRFDIVRTRDNFFLDSLYKEDQKYHWMRSKTGIDSTGLYDRLDYECFYQYVSTFGFPFENGKVLDSLYLTDAPYFILIRHFIQQQLLSSEEMDVLWQQVCQGKLHPYKHAEWYSLFHTSDPFGFHHMVWFFVRPRPDGINDNIGVLWYHPATVVQKQLYNKNRQDFGLPSFDEEIKKVKWFLETDNLFHLNIPSLTGEPLTYQEYKEMKNRNTISDKE